MGRKKLKSADAPSEDIFDDATNEQTAIAVVPTLEPQPDVEALACDVGGARQIVEWVNARFEQNELDGYRIGAVMNRASIAKVPTLLGYASWDDFREGEVRIPKTTLYRYMAIAAALTEQEFRDLGPSRAGIIVRLPEKERRALLPEAKTLTVRALAERVSEIADGPKPAGVVQKQAHSGNAITLGLRAETTDIPLTNLGGGAAVGALACLNGRSLQIAVGRANDGSMYAVVTPFGGDA